MRVADNMADKDKIFNAVDQNEDFNVADQDEDFTADDDMWNNNKNTVG